MNMVRRITMVGFLGLVATPLPRSGLAQFAVGLPEGVKAVWDVDQAQRESTPTRERICINGLWRWQPADRLDEQVPDGNWGYFKVPGCWPGLADYMQKDCQTVYAHPRWANQRLARTAAAWYEREVTVPDSWAGKRIALSAEYLNSYAVVYIDGQRAGELRYPAGELTLTSPLQPGRKHVLSMLVVALPLKGVMLSYNDTNSARNTQGTVQRRGLCGDIYLSATPSGPRITDVKIDPSVRKAELSIEAGLEGLADGAAYRLRAEISRHGRPVKQLTSQPFSAAQLTEKRFTFAGAWQPEDLWDIHTPQNMYSLTLSLLDSQGQPQDVAQDQRFGFREFWIDGRDFFLNGSRLFVSAVPLDNAQVSAAAASYDAAKESLRRLKSFGINFVYTHNYGCEPGTHLSFAEILRAADDVGMLVALSQPHFGHYDWQAVDADQTNGYARHAEFFVRQAQNHPSVVAYSTSHNATGYAEDMNPYLMDGVHDPRDSWSQRNVQRALRAEAIITRLDPHRIVYHHSSGNLSSMHTINFYPNWVPIQEMSDWFEHWATTGIKPVFLVEYGAPFTWDFAMYRGWYKGQRSFGSAVVPWELCLAEWNAQFFGDSAFQISDVERACLRWEAEQFRAGKLWHRWDYPYQMGSTDFDEQYPAMGRYIADNWPAFRTWGLSANSPWQHGVFWKLRDGVDRQRKSLSVDWDHLQQPGFSADYLDDQYERMDLAYKITDWIPTPAADALLRTNMPLLAYIGGKPTRFTSKDHIFCPGETVAKQVIVINNSRETVSCECRWSLNLPTAVTGQQQVRVETGDQARLPIQFTLPATLAPGTYELASTAVFSNGETQKDVLELHVIPRPQPPQTKLRIALFDPRGETVELLRDMNLNVQVVEPTADLSAFDVLVIGKAALTADGPGPNLGRVREGLRVIVFEQTADVLEKRLGFRVQEYGLRQVFRRVADHPLLVGLTTDQLRDWRGQATILPPRLDYQSQPGQPPTIKWCGIDVTRAWRCGCWGNVASVLIEKPARGDFLPIVDGGYSLQYSPLIEYREGRGMVLFCQLDVTGRTEQEPAARTLARNIVQYVSDWQSAPRRTAVYVGNEHGRRYLEFAGVALTTYAGGSLSPDQVLILGSECGPHVAGNRGEIAEFLQAGGHLVALGLDQAEASTVVPGVVTKNQEHIAAFFEPPNCRSPLAGIGPADVHNRDAGEIPLVTGGATVVGDGVLALNERANVIFDQLPPHAITAAWGASASFVVDAQDAAEGRHSALLTLGTASRFGDQFGQQVKQGGTRGNRYTFSMLAKGIGGPVHARLEVERAATPWDRAVKGEEQELAADQWSEIHVTFTVDRAFPEGWSAYLASSQEGARLRIDACRLYEGDYVPSSPSPKEEAVLQPSGPPNLLVNPGFEKGEEPWTFSFREKLNVRRTFRRSAQRLSRVLGNLGVAAETPLLSHFATPPGASDNRSNLLRNGDLRADANDDGVADQWECSLSGQDTSRALERAENGSEPARSQRLSATAPTTDGRAEAMLAQLGVPVRDGQWYRITFRARAENLRDARCNVTVTNTKTWRSFFEYQTFSPTPQWKQYTFLVRANGSEDSQTRFQVWHSGPGTLWFADLSMQPCAPPSHGRWQAGLYQDEPIEWDDPYRFFRW